MITCPTGFVYMYDGCYKQSSVPLSWIDAGIAAVQLNASLASIHSEPQNRWIAEHLWNKGWLRGGLPNLWIGLNQIAEQDVWRYTDGSPFDYTRWPSAPAAGAHCVFCATDTRWYGDECAVGKYSLLKWNESAVQLPEGEISNCLCYVVLCYVMLCMCIAHLWRVYYSLVVVDHVSVGFHVHVRRLLQVQHAGIELDRREYCGRAAERHARLHPLRAAEPLVV